VICKQQQKQKQKQKQNQRNPEQGNQDFGKKLFEDEVGD
jgi:hypothetical protein